MDDRHLNERKMKSFLLIPGWRRWVVAVCRRPPFPVVSVDPSGSEVQAAEASQVPLPPQEQKQELSPPGLLELLVGRQRGSLAERTVV